MGATKQIFRPNYRSNSRSLFGRSASALPFAGHHRPTCSSALSLSVIGERARRLWISCISPRRTATVRISATVAPHLRPVTCFAVEPETHHTVDKAKIENTPPQKRVKAQKEAGVVLCKVMYRQTFLVLKQSRHPACPNTTRNLRPCQLRDFRPRPSRRPPLALSARSPFSMVPPSF